AQPAAATRGATAWAREAERREGHPGQAGWLGAPGRARRSRVILDRAAARPLRSPSTSRIQGRGGAVKLRSGPSRRRTSTPSSNGSVGRGQVQNESVEPLFLKIFV